MNLRFVLLFIILCVPFVYASDPIVIIDSSDKSIQFPVVVDIREGQRTDYAYLNGNNNFTGTNTFNNVTVVNFIVMNVTGNVTASGFCYTNGTCLVQGVLFDTNVTTQCSGANIPLGNGSCVSFAGITAGMLSGNGTNRQVTYWNTTGVTGESNFTWSDNNDTLTIGGGSCAWDFGSNTTDSILSTCSNGLLLNSSNVTMGGNGTATFSIESNTSHNIIQTYGYSNIWNGSMDFYGNITANNICYLNGSCTNGLFYNITNPSNFINRSNLTTWGYNTTTELYGQFYNKSNPSGYVNSTNLTALGYVKNNTNAAYQLHADVVNTSSLNLSRNVNISSDDTSGDWTNSALLRIQNNKGEGRGTKLLQVVNASGFEKFAIDAYYDYNRYRIYGGMDKNWTNLCANQYCDANSGRIDIAASQIFLFGSVLPGSTWQWQRTGDASNNASQYPSYGVKFQDSLWAGTYALQYNPMMYGGAQNVQFARGGMFIQGSSDWWNSVVDGFALFPDGRLSVGGRTIPSNATLNIQPLRSFGVSERSGTSPCRIAHGYSTGGYMGQTYTCNGTKVYKFVANAGGTTFNVSRNDGLTWFMNNSNINTTASLIECGLYIQWEAAPATAGDTCRIPVFDADPLNIENADGKRLAYMDKFGNLNIMNGNITLSGNATVWDDMQAPLLASQAPAANPFKIGSFIGSLEMPYFEDKTVALEQNANLIFQISHRINRGSAVEFHCHGSTGSVAGSGTNNVTFSIEYTCANITGQYQATRANTSTFTVSASTYSHELIDFHELQGCNAGISEIIAVRLHRNSSLASDDYNNNYFVSSCDVHMEISRMGSDDEAAG